eukprot:COSAG04_NODE_18056_length_452_cov_0.764873_1_plen_93_part_10
MFSQASQPTSEPLPEPEPEPEPEPGHEPEPKPEPEPEPEPEPAPEPEPEPADPALLLLVSSWCGDADGPGPPFTAITDEDCGAGYVANTSAAA